MTALCWAGETAGSRVGQSAGWTGFCSAGKTVTQTAAAKDAAMAEKMAVETVTHSAVKSDGETAESWDEKWAASTDRTMAARTAVLWVGTRAVS